ncbi:MAG: hypothetical protein RL095_789 [Verrucomicrobiota bacterium]|jgi:uncharacterized protein (DUF58 family)
MRPTPRLLLLLCLLLVIAIAAVWLRLPALAALAGLLLLGAAVLDAGLSRLRPGLLQIRRDVGRILPVGIPARIHLELVYRGKRKIELEVVDHAPPSFIEEAQHLLVSLPPGSRAEAFYRVQPRQRGPARFAGVSLRFPSRLGLWQMESFVVLPDEVKVYPNYAEIARFAELAGMQRLDLMNIHRSRNRGEGTEFKDIREFRTGDRLSTIDWKVTARYGTPHTRQFHQETAQQIFFLLDCGRNMRTCDGAVSHFDAALNSLILLSHVATGQGDCVGMMNFASPSPRFLPKLQGATAVQQLLNTTYDLHSSLNVPDYEETAAQLLARLNRRQLILVLSNLHEEEADEVLPFLQRLRSRHLVVYASLREKALDDAAHAEIENDAQALNSAFALDLLDRRAQALALIRQAGIITLDCTPDQLPAALVNSYFEIKASGRL